MDGIINLLKVTGEDPINITYLVIG